MSKLTQKNRTMQLLIPSLGEDKLLITQLNGAEAISELFEFEILAFCANEDMPRFSDMIGTPACVSMKTKSDDDKRYFNGIVRSFRRDFASESHTSVALTIVPKVWLLTNTTRSRIFQQIPIPDILKKVFDGYDVDLQLTGTYQPRDYCVQYRESDFAFASRLMEEEGIYYFFVHTEEGHQMIVADSPQGHLDLEHCPTLVYDPVSGHADHHERVFGWSKTQELRTGAVALWDHSFEKPDSNFEATIEVDEDLQIGKEAHKLKIAGNERLEFYEFPGGYAQRFDGINPGGDPRPEEVAKIGQDNARTAKVRIKQEAIRMINISAETHYPELCAGYKFALERHDTDDDDYVITRAYHNHEQPENYGAAYPGVIGRAALNVRFSCIPFKLPFVPTRITARPLIHGTQVAVVTGPAGEEIFTDKYGRVKVQFFWDREGKRNDQSSCWIRVGTAWAGNNWGMIHIPRIGQEVVVAFEEGDPDQPIIISSVYNAHEMPPHELPANKTWSGVKSRSTPGAGSQNLNEIRFEDKIGHEYIFIHGEKDVHFRCKGSYFGSVGGSFHETVYGDARTRIKKNKHVTVEENYAVNCQRDYTVASLENMTLSTDTAMHLKASMCALFDVGETLLLRGSDIIIDSGRAIVIEATNGITLKSGGSVVTVSPTGVFITGSQVHLNSSSMEMVIQTPSFGSPDPPELPIAPLRPEETRPTTNPAGSASEDQHDPTSEENKDKTHWIEVQLTDESGAPVQGEACEITLPDGKKARKSTNKDGLIRIDRIDAGDCKIRWIHLDQDAVSQ